MKVGSEEEDSKILTVSVASYRDSEQVYSQYQNKVEDDKELVVQLASRSNRDNAEQRQRGQAENPTNHPRMLRDSFVSRKPMRGA